MIRSAVAALAFCSNTVLGALTTEQIVANLNTLTTKSQDLQAPAESITAVNGPLIVVGQGPFPVSDPISLLQVTNKTSGLLTYDHTLQEIIRGFVDIVNTGSNDAQELQGTDAITNADDADSVYTAFRDFALVHEKLLNTLTGKAALFSDVPFIGQPIAAVLRQDESVIDVSNLYSTTRTLQRLYTPR
jgi:hypothetical protein